MGSFKSGFRDSENLDDPEEQSPEERSSTTVQQNPEQTPRVSFEKNSIPSATLRPLPLSLSYLILGYHPFPYFICLQQPHTNEVVIEQTNNDQDISEEIPAVYQNERRRNQRPRQAAAIQFVGFSTLVLIIFLCLWTPSIGTVSLFGWYFLVPDIICQTRQSWASIWMLLAALALFSILLLAQYKYALNFKRKNMWLKPFQH